MKRCVVAFLLIVIVTQTWAGEKKETATETPTPETNSDAISFRVGGYATSVLTHMTTDTYSEYQVPPHTPDKKKSLTADLNRLRLSPELNVSDNFHARLDLDAEAIYATYLNSPEFRAFFGTGEENDFFDLTADEEKGEGYYRLKVHRAYFKWILNSLTITAGRQQIRFGSARLWDPLDLLNPVFPLSVEGAEEQRGTDAVRLEYYLTPTAELDLIVDGKRLDNDRGFTSSNTKCNVLSRMKWTAGETDIAGILGSVSNRTIYGVDVSSVMFDGLFNTSAVYADPENGASFLQASAGYEYNFRYVYLLMEYFFNQEGLNANDELKYAYASNQITGVTKETYEILSNRLITHNAHYVGIASAFDINALLRADMFVIYDVEGNALFFTPSLKYNVTTNLDVTFGIMTAGILNRQEKSSDFDFLATTPLFFSSAKLYF